MGWPGSCTSSAHAAVHACLQPALWACMQQAAAPHRARTALGVSPPRGSSSRGAAGVQQGLEGHGMGLGRWGWALPAAVCELAAHASTLVVRVPCRRSNCQLSTGACGACGGATSTSKGLGGRPWHVPQPCQPHIAAAASSKLACGLRCRRRCCLGALQGWLVGCASSQQPDGCMWAHQTAHP